MTFVAAALVLALAAAAPSARAVEPQRGSFVQQGVQEHDDICAFPVIETYVRSGRSFFFSDPAGLPLAMRTEIAATATFANPDSGRSLTDSDHYSLVLDLTEGTVSSFGLVFHVTLGHGRSVLMDAGRVVLGADQTVLFEGGPHQFLDGDVAAFCSALA
jgi:hypothetical protein